MSSIYTYYVVSNLHVASTQDQWPCLFIEKKKVIRYLQQSTKKAVELKRVSICFVHA